MTDKSPYAANGYAAIKLEPHLHTLHSDGDDSVAAMFEACRSAGYDAVALTDHNTLSGLAEAERSAAELGLILIPGVEVTTFRGHAVVLGVSRVPEWRDLEARGMDALASEVHAQGGLLSVAHPAALGSPVCSGCAWDWPIDASSVDFSEVLLSEPDPSESAASLAFWRNMLGRGGRVAPVGIGDVHSASIAAAPRAATCVYVRSRSRDDVLDALRQRRMFATHGQQLDFWLERSDGRVALVGERVTSDGWTLHTSPAAARLIEVEINRDERCVYAELRDAQGRLEAITAPIWIDTSH